MSVSTDANAEKLNVESEVRPFRVKVSVMVFKLFEEMVVTWVTLFAMKLPWIFWIPSNATLSVVPEARAILPEKVEHFAIVEASAAL